MDRDQEPLNLTKDEVRQRLEDAFRAADVRRAHREHALWCASMVYNGLLSRPSPIHLDGPRITALADHFAEWLAETSPGGEAAREAPSNDLQNAPGGVPK